MKDKRELYNNTNYNRMKKFINKIRILIILKCCQKQPENKVDIMIDLG